MTPTREISAPIAGGDPAAAFALANDLLTAAEASQGDFFQAVALIDQAAAAGHPDATERRAVFEAAGVARPQSWETAFDALQRAAELGSESARRQLVFLADTSVDPLLPSGVPASFWSERRCEISLDRLLSYGERRALSKAPRIRVIEHFATAAECRWLIDRARGRLGSALVFDLSGQEVIDPGRTNAGTNFQVPDTDMVIEVIRARISAAVHIPVPVFEPTQVLHYSVGQEFKRHVDYLEPGNAHHQEQLRSHGQRIATFLIYLNEEFEGGETEFSQIGLRYRGMTGDAIFWANCHMDGSPDPLTLHAGLPPITGEKWILSQWIRDRASPVR